jgi:hypothetical protein
VEGEWEGEEQGEGQGERQGEGEERTGDSEGAARAPRTGDGSPVDDASPGEPTLGPSRAGRFATIGCLMTVAGFFSGAMVAVLIAKIHGWATHCQPVDAELPACSWEQFAGVGGLFGAVSLPALVFWRLLSPRWRSRQGGSEAGVRDL